jgi:hypothetical protein
MQLPTSQQSRRLRPQLHTMPLRNLLLEHLIHKLVLFYHRQPLKLGRLNFNGVHGPAAAAYVLDLWVLVLASARTRCGMV